MLALCEMGVDRPQSAQSGSLLLAAASACASPSTLFSLLEASERELWLLWVSVLVVRQLVNFTACLGVVIVLRAAI